MRAIIIAAGSSNKIVSITDKMPACMLPLVDKPFVQHLVEYLIVKGITNIDFVLSEFPEQLESLLGDGTRWGGKFSFHPVRDADQPWKAVRLLCRERDEPVLIADANYMVPNIGDGATLSAGKSILWMDSEKAIGDASDWSGWCVCGTDTLNSVSDTATRDDIYGHVLKAGGIPTQCARVLTVKSFDRLIEAQKLVLHGWQEELVITGLRKSADIVIGRGARVSPTAILNGPLYVGEFSEIGEGVTLEPGTVVARDCVIDFGCHVQDSIILPGTYVGKELDVVGCVVDHGVLYNAKLGTEIKIPDNFLLGRLTPGSPGSRPTTIGSQFIGILLLALLWPLLLVAIVFRATAQNGDALYRKRMVRLPASADKETWTYFDRFFVGKPSAMQSDKFTLFLHADLPGLLNLVCGDMHLVGAPGRSPEEIDELEPEWRELYLGSKVGLVTEVRVRCGLQPEIEEQHASDTFYAVNASKGYDMKLFGDFVRKQFGTDRS
jgi:NDP-sugar pyrophosphorylase family protein